MGKYIFQWSEEESLLLVRCWADSFCELGKVVGTDLDTLGVTKQRVTTTYVTEENAAVSTEFSKQFLEATFQKEFIASIAACKKIFDSFFSTVRSTDVSKLTNQELVGLLEGFRENVIQTMVFFDMMQAEFTDTPYANAKKGIKAAGVENLESTVSLLLMPDKFDVIKREELDFSKLAENPTRSAMLEHAYKYAFLFYNSYSEVENTEFLRSRLSSAKPFAELKKEFEAELVNRKAMQLKIEAKLDVRTRRDVSFLRKLAWERLELKDKWAGAEFRFLNLFKEIAKRMSISLTDIFYVYSIPELVAFLSREALVDPAALKQRKNFYAVQVNAGQVTTYSGDSAKALVSELLPDYFKAMDSSEICGQVANPGKVQAKAHVVKVAGISELQQCIKNFQEGEVLITTMTQPNMVPLMKKASAVVTDEGGMTSHAAVLSSEFNVPCIVGTHIGTKAIKTGDLIEVNADKGIVRKLKEGDFEK